MTELTYETIQIDRDGAVDWLVPNRPEALNAINTQMVTELRDYFGGLLENTDTRIVVMRGEGRAFCAGLDIKQSQHRVDSLEHKPIGRGFGFQGYLAERALSPGLVSEVVPDDQLLAAAKPYLDEMLTTSPMGLRMTKEGLNMAIDANSLEAAMAVENRNQIMCSRTGDAREGMRAFLEKRPPIYSGN